MRQRVRAVAAGAGAPRTNEIGMRSTMLAVKCPHCQEEIELQVQLEAAAVPPLSMRFATAERFESWLKASGLSVEAFEQLPVYQWHRDEFDPLLQALGHRRAGASAISQARA
jgi:hypothetical protein